MFIFRKNFRWMVILALHGSLLSCSGAGSTDIPPSNTPNTHASPSPEITLSSDDPPSSESSSFLSKAEEVRSYLDRRYGDYLAFVNTLAVDHEDAFKILKTHLSRAMRAYTVGWTERDLDNIAKMQLANLVATSNRQEDLVSRFGQSITFNDAFLPPQPYGDDEDGVNIALIDSGFNAVPLLEMDKVLAYYTYNPLTAHLELVETAFPLPEYAYHMGRQFRDVGSMDFNLGSKMRKPLNNNAPDSPVWDQWTPVESPLSQNLKANVTSLVLKKNEDNYLTLTTNPYVQLPNNRHFVSVLRENGVFPQKKEEPFRKRALLYDRDNGGEAHGAMLTRTLLQHAPRSRILLIDLEFLDKSSYPSQAAAEAAYRKLQDELDALMEHYKIHFATRALYVSPKFNGPWDRYLEGDRFVHNRPPQSYMDIFGGAYYFHNSSKLFNLGLDLTKRNFSTALVVNSFSSGCAELPEKTSTGLSSQEFASWAAKDPAISAFSFSPTYTYDQNIASNELFINRHVCFNYHNPKCQPNLCYFDSVFANYYKVNSHPSCFAHQHQGACKKISYDTQAKYWQYHWQDSDRPDYVWTDYLGFTTSLADFDVSKDDWVFEISGSQLPGDSSSITPMVAAWASYVKRTYFPREARSPELFRKIKDHLTGHSSRPFQDPLSKDEFPVFIDGRGGDLARYHIKPGLLASLKVE